MDEEAVSIAVAAHLTGVPERTLRRWVREETVPSRNGHRGRLVRVSDVQMAAGTAVHGRPLAQNGRIVADSGRRLADMPPGESVIHDLAEGRIDEAPLAGPPSSPEPPLSIGEAPVRAVIDQSISSALAPLVAAIERLSERVEHLAADNGRLMADNGRLQAEVERLRAAQQPQSAPASPPVPEPTPAPTPRPAPSWGQRLRRWWRS